MRNYYVAKHIKSTAEKISTLNEKKDQMTITLDVMMDL